MKIKILFSLLLCSAVAVYSQNNIVDFKIHGPYLINGVANIQGDSLQFNDSLESNVLSLYDKSFNDSLIENYDFPGSVYLANKSETQFIRLNSTPTDGFWSDYFTIGYINGSIKKAYIKTEIDKYTADSKICLGMKIKDFLKLVKRKPDYTFRSDGQFVYKYYWFSKNTAEYKAYGIPSKVATFIFKNGKLKKFGFGKFKAEIDKTLFPSAGLLIKNRG